MSSYHGQDSCPLRNGPVTTPASSMLPVDQIMTVILFSKKQIMLLNLKQCKTFI